MQSPAHPARSGSLSLDPHDEVGLPHATEPAVPAIEKANDSQWDFTFSECDFGLNGEIVLARNGLPTAANRFASSTAALSVILSPTLTLIAAEILPKAKIQKNDAASFLASHGAQGAKSSNKITNVLAAAFALEQAGLETDMLLVQMALEQNSPDDVARYLSCTADRIAILKSGLPALAGQKSDGTASAGQLALSASLDAMEVACKVGADLLADEQAPDVGDTSTARQPVQRETPVITPSNQDLMAELDALDALMDQKILPVTSMPIPTPPPKQ